MHLLDTDTLAHLHAGHPKVIDRLRSLDDSTVGITIAVEELVRTVL
jgi:predicted nucleic acid-binding protein